MLPKTYKQFWQQVATNNTNAYQNHQSTWLKHLAPEAAVNLPAKDLFDILTNRLGKEVVNDCLNPNHTHPSPAANEPNGNWLKTTNTVGVNVRTIGDFLAVVKYALTLPDHIRAIHLLPIWEPGVVGSLYGMASWQLNPEFYSQELYELGVVALEDQLKVVANLLHAMGKVVGMDVIPHTDRYSEMVLANPDHFEWLRRWDTQITNHYDQLHEAVQGQIYDWLVARGPATPAYGMVGQLWQLSEAERLLLLFGEPKDYLGRQRRRIDLVDYLYNSGYEPVPATMAPPYRGLEVDPSPQAMTVDSAGRVWRDYRITEPQEMSRVFGPLTRYKLYGRKDNNQEWQIDFDRPRHWVWTYLTNHYAAQAWRYNFDFMRGDMSHVQMRPEGVPAVADAYYDPLRAVKLKVQQRTPHFAYFAESFLTADGYMAYGSEVEHLERSEAEVTLGNLQSTVPNTEEFWEMTQHYLNVAQTSTVTPAWTVITGDKDDPRFDLFHHFGEVERVFTGLFMQALPMYYSLGFEQRDRHFARAANEVYSKLYVFQEERGDKAVGGPFQWGGNLGLFAQLTRLHSFAEGMLMHLGPEEVLQVGYVVWGRGPKRKSGAGSSSKLLVWVRTASDGEGAYLFVVSFSGEEQREVSVPTLAGYSQADLLFATEERGHELLRIMDGVLVIERLTGAICYLLK